MNRKKENGIFFCPPPPPPGWNIIDGFSFFYGANENYGTSLVWRGKNRKQAHRDSPGLRLIGIPYLVQETGDKKCVRKFGKIFYAKKSQVGHGPFGVVHCGAADADTARRIGLVELVDGVALFVRHATEDEDKNILRPMFEHGYVGHEDICHSTLMVFTMFFSKWKRSENGGSVE